MFILLVFGEAFRIICTTRGVVELNQPAKMASGTCGGGCTIRVSKESPILHVDVRSVVCGLDPATKPMMLATTRGLNLPPSQVSYRLNRRRELLYCCQWPKVPQS